ncbi:molybdopterin molybdenumtransferase [Aliidongia dinghuensis]|uniref:Molybdopterin molybdenumtransferase n=1 Tax=Aliidongia dinghuensis TaxID=1867774 RepID=A0A8J2Z052_9PROT|nr:gephyrin-like molybdotransferase Glp [Aliidongia dinghuensis]GGF43368.1 molybdopterin molybdenumtransferase [Aliidongia dinghuensis]
MNAINPNFGCATGGLSVEHALKRVLALVARRLPVEEVPIDACAGRVIAAGFRAVCDLPRFDQSAMDGYAIRSADMAAASETAVIGRTVAGAMPGWLVYQTAHRIFTGAPLPLGADAVIAQENVERIGAALRLAAVPLPGTNVRRRGEDVEAGRRLIPAGTRLDWRHVGMLAAQGARSVAVRRRPRVTLLSSGRELREPGQTLSPGQIYDCNLPMLAALLANDAVELRTMPIVDDTAETMQAALLDGAANADLVLTTAGISVGDEDHVRQALQELGGALAVFKVAMKPGKPLAAGRLGQAIFLGLPGNPLAALAGAITFVRPLLAKMSGATPQQPLVAHAAFSLDRKAGRSEFLLARLRQRGASLWAERVGPDGSGRLRPLLDADGFCCLPEDQATVREAEPIRFIPFL